MSRIITTVIVFTIITFNNIETFPQIYHESENSRDLERKPYPEPNFTDLKPDQHHRKLYPPNQGNDQRYPNGDIITYIQPDHRQQGNASNIEYPVTDQHHHRPDLPKHNKEPHQKYPNGEVIGESQLLSGQFSHRDHSQQENPSDLPIRNNQRYPNGDTIREHFDHHPQGIPHGIDRRPIANQNSHMSNPSTQNQENYQRYPNGDIDHHQKGNPLVNDGRPITNNENSHKSDPPTQNQNNSQRYPNGDIIRDTHRQESEQLDHHQQHIQEDHNNTSTASSPASPIVVSTYEVTTQKVEISLFHLANVRTNCKLDYTGKCREEYD